MYRVVHGSGGTARRANLERFQVAGKTGTAELGAGQPNHAWFAGFAPYDNPKIAFAAVNERTSGHGGTHAAPIIAKVLEQIWPEVEEMK
jgi:cell division protein FtsI/penicillin-binding protein 2